MAELDVVTLDEVKSRLGGSVARATNDADIQADISALSALFDAEFGAVVQRPITDEEVTLDACLNGFTEYWPVLADPAPTVDAGTVDPISYRFGLMSYDTSTVTTVTYTAGRFASTDDVSEQFKAAFVVTLRNWRQAERTAPNVPPGPDYPTPRTSFPTFALPNAAAELLSKYRRPTGFA